MARWIDSAVARHRRHQRVWLSILVASIAGSIVLAPVIAGGQRPVAWLLLATAPIIAAVPALGTSPIWLVLLATLGLIKIADQWVTLMTDSGSTLDVLAVGGGVFVVLAIIRLVGLIYRQGTDSASRLLAAVAGYLLMVFVFSNLYNLVLRHDPTALSGAEGMTLDRSDVIYFSVVTQTTLGYGEITPRVPLARSLVMLQSMLGVLYVAITIAGLVGTRDDRNTVALTERET